MLDELLNALTQKPWNHELTASTWIECIHLYQTNHDKAARIKLLGALSSHTGIKRASLEDYFNSSINTPAENTSCISALKALERSVTQNIAELQANGFCKQLDLVSLAMSRNEWVAVLHQFTQQNRSKVTSGFFLNTLSAIRHVNVESLLQTASLQRKQPLRAAKTPRAVTNEQEPNPKAPKYYKGDKGVNPLILEKNNTNERIAAQIIKTGARVTSLEPATPERGYTVIKKTPGGTKTRVLCTVGSNSFFKPLSPMEKIPNNGRLDIRSALKRDIMAELPKVAYKKAESIEFTVTKESIDQRTGKSRGRGQKAIVKASSSDIFRAHGIKINVSANRCYHLAHLIAHFLGGEQGVDNLIPATAAANYNTLEVIELRVKELLTGNYTQEVTIHVEPKYSGDSLIPDSLIYSFRWEQTNNAGLVTPFSETHIISPQSHERITKSQHEAINIIREALLEAEQNESTSPFKL